MSIHRTEAIVLKRHDCRETSLIVNFYSRDFGKLSGLMKGIKEDPSKFASSVGLFSLNEVIFYKKRNSSLHLVSQCDLRDDFSAIRGSLIKVGIASLMMELLDCLMPPEDPQTSIFDLTRMTLEELGRNPNPEKILMIYRIKLLVLSGFKPHFDSCVSCGVRINGESRFSLRLGGLLCPQCCRKDTSSRSIFRGTIASILHIERNDFKNSLNLGLNPQIKKELDAILSAFLRFHLERELKAQKTLEKIKAATEE